MKNAKLVWFVLTVAAAIIGIWSFAQGYMNEDLQQAVSWYVVSIASVVIASALLILARIENLVGELLAKHPSDPALAQRAGIAKMLQGKG